MSQHLSLVADDELAERIEVLSRRYGLPRQEVLRQVISVGLDEIEGGEN